MPTFESHAEIDLTIEFNKKTVEVAIPLAQICGLTTLESENAQNTAVTLNKPIHICKGYGPRDIIHTNSSIAEIKELKRATMQAEQEQNIALLKKHGIRLIA